jgi:hypothetical protein
MWLSRYATQERPQEQALLTPESEIVGEELSSGEEVNDQEMPALEEETQSWMTSLTMLIAALVVTFFLYIITRRILRPKAEPGELEQLADKAQNAIQAIGLGMNFENIILQCYVEMTHTIEKSRGIQRKSTMTPLEFQEHLEKAGVPAEPVRKLTRLFETVRYGHQPVSDLGRREAVESLNQIVAYCRSLK